MKQLTTAEAHSIRDIEKLNGVLKLLNEMSESYLKSNYSADQDLLQKQYNMAIIEINRLATSLNRLMHVVQIEKTYSRTMSSFNID